MTYKQKKSMIAGTDPVKRAKEVLKGYRDAFVKGYNHSDTAENKVSKTIKKGYDSVNKTKQVAKKRATTTGSIEGLSGGVAKSAPLQKKGWMKRLFSKKKKKNKEETSTEHYERQIKEKDDYYAAQKELHRLPKR